MVARHLWPQKLSEISWRFASCGELLDSYLAANFFSLNVTNVFEDLELLNFESFQASIFIQSSTSLSASISPRVSCKASLVTMTHPGWRSSAWVATGSPEEVSRGWTKLKRWARGIRLFKLTAMPIFRSRPMWKITHLSVLLKISKADDTWDVVDCPTQEKWTSSLHFAFRVQFQSVAAGKEATEPKNGYKRTSIGPWSIWNDAIWWDGTVEGTKITPHWATGDTIVSQAGLVCFDMAAEKDLLTT